MSLSQKQLLHLENGDKVFISQGARGYRGGYRNRKYKKSHRQHKKSHRAGRRTKHRKIKRRKTKKYHRKRRRSRKKRRSKQGGLRILLSDMYLGDIENYKRKYSHKKDCGACALRFMGLHPALINGWSQLARQKGSLSKEEMIEAFNALFSQNNLKWGVPISLIPPQGNIHDWGSRAMGFSYSYTSFWGVIKLFFEQIAPGQGAVVLFRRQPQPDGTQTGHYVIFAKTARGRPFIINPQKGNIIINADDSRQNIKNIVDYLAKEKVVSLSILDGGSTYNPRQEQEEVEAVPNTAGGGGGGGTIPPRSPLRLATTAGTVASGVKLRKYGNIGIWAAATAGDLTQEDLTNAIAIGTDLTWKNPRGGNMSPLTVAAMGVHLDTVQLLLDNGVKPTSAALWAILHKFTYKNNVEIVSALLEKAGAFSKHVLVTRPWPVPLGQRKEFESKSVTPLHFVGRIIQLLDGGDDTIDEDELANFTPMSSRLKEISKMLSAAIDEYVSDQEAAAAASLPPPAIPPPSASIL